MALPVPILLRLDPDLLAALDAARGDVPRTVFIRKRLEEVVLVPPAAPAVRIAKPSTGPVFGSAGVPLAGTFERKPYQKGQKR